MQADEIMFRVIGLILGIVIFVYLSTRKKEDNK